MTDPTIAQSNTGDGVYMDHIEVISLKYGSECNAARKQMTIPGAFDRQPQQRFILCN